jgi:hypothetical protein
MKGVIQQVTHAVALGTPIAQRRDQEVGPKLTPTTHIGGLNSGEHYIISAHARGNSSEIQNVPDSHHVRLCMQRQKIRKLKSSRAMRI